MILSAARIQPRSLPRPKTLAARRGLGFQRKFVKQFETNLPAGFTVESEPWFEYTDSRSPGEKQICCPDLLAFDSDNGFYIVIEIKQTWTPLAIQKLRDVYCPVVRTAQGGPARPVVVAKTLIPTSPRPQSTVSFALLSDEPLIHWTGNGPILW